MIHLRNNTHLKCTSTHHSSLHLIQSGSSGIITKSNDDIYSVLVIDNVNYSHQSFYYEMSKNLLPRYWKIDLYSELIENGLNPIYLSKVNMLNSTNKLASKYIQLQRSGICGDFFCMKMQSFIDECLMEQALN